MDNLNTENLRRKKVFCTGAHDGMIELDPEYEEKKTEKLLSFHQDPDVIPL